MCTVDFDIHLALNNACHTIEKMSRHADSRAERCTQDETFDHTDCEESKVWARLLRDLSRSMSLFNKAVNREGGFMHGLELDNPDKKPEEKGLCCKIS
jgi:phenylalanine-4-hydroxylase